MSTGKERIGQLSPLKRALLKLEQMKTRLDATDRARSEPIAIIGMGSRFPGAPSLTSYWQMLRDGVDAVSEVPADRWDVDAIYDPEPATPGKMVTRSGGFLDDVRGFDPGFFGISPREASRMDPQQRLLLEVSWEALEDAGQPADALRGGNTGVFVGISNHDYSMLLQSQEDIRLIDPYTGTGNAFSIAANRLSYLYDWRGPSFSVDTACSSSLVAAHLACQSLRVGECDLAIVAGVNVMLTPALTVTFSQARMMSPTGRCHTFDADADGYVRGEGCGVILLKRLSKALEDGDSIWALIRGTAINQDGRSNGLTAPNGLSQQAVIRDALAQARVKPEQIGFIEAHGTGTRLGDPIEVQALGKVMEGRPQDDPCLIGSAKTNFGHLESAAGIAGLIKVALSLKHEAVPPHLHFHKINPFIPIDELPLDIPTSLTPWPKGERRRFGAVSSFGFGGTNAHIVLEEAPSLQPVANLADRPWHVLALSARDESALRQLAEAYHKHLKEHPGLPVADICYSANTGRAHMEERMAMSASSVDDLMESLDEFAGGAMPAGVAYNRWNGQDLPKVAFLFTGQGAQYPGMGHQLYETEPTFRATLDRCAEILDTYLDTPLLSVLFPEPGSESPIHETAYTQPALFAIEYALAQLWLSWGVKPDCVLGHSVGEYVAACIAGVFSLEDGLKLIAARGRLMQSLPQDGDMAVIFTEPARVNASLAGYERDVSLAAVNGPTNVVISGKTEAVAVLVDQFQATGVETRTLRVSHAFHSPLMDSILDDFQRVADEIDYHPPAIRLVSNVSGQFFDRNESPSAVYWRNHIRQAVQFDKGMKTLAERGCKVFLEIGPQPVLVGMGRRCLPQVEGKWLPSLKRKSEDWPTILGSLSEIHVEGASIDWQGFDQAYARNTLRLPTYQFQRQDYWLDLATAMPPAYRAATTGEIVHPLLGRRLFSPLRAQQYEVQLFPDDLPVLSHYRLLDRFILPQTAFLEMAISAGRQHWPEGNIVISDVTYSEPLIQANEGRSLQCAVTPKPDDHATFEIYSVEGDESSTWRLRARGEMSVGHIALSTRAYQVDIESIQNQAQTHWSGADYYDHWRRRNLDYGPEMQLFSQVWLHESQAIGQVDSNQRQRDWSAPGRPTALLDGFHQLLATLAQQVSSTDDALYLPIGLGKLTVYGPLGNSVVMIATLNEHPEQLLDIFIGDVSLLDADGQTLVEIHGLQLQQVNAGALTTFLGGVSRIDELPITANIQAPSSLNREELEQAEPMARKVLLQEAMRSQLARVLRLKSDKIDLDQPITNLGLDSIMAIELKNIVERGLQVELPVAAVVEGPSLNQLVDMLLPQLSEEHVAGTPGLIPLGEVVGDHPLSYGQQAMWLQHQVAPDSVFNPTYAVRITSKLDINRLHNACQYLAERHPALRTTFPVLDAEPVQRVAEDIEVFFDRVDATDWSDQALHRKLAEVAHLKFDLEKGPLLRVHLFSRSEQDHVLLLTAHHIVVDLWSLAVLISEVGELYSSSMDTSSLSPLELHYTDYVHWQSELLNGAQGERMWTYWRDQLAGPLPLLDLPTDRPRPLIQSHTGKSLTLHLSAELTQSLKQLSESQNITLYMTLLAAFQVLMHRYSGQDDIIVGSPTSGRSQAGLADVVGYFVNPVALRADLSGKPSFVAFVNQVRETVLSALRHQDFPFAMLVEKLHPERSASHLPIFQVMFVLQRAHLLHEEGLSQLSLDAEGQQMNLGGLPLQSFPIEQLTAPFDITMMMAESNEGLAASLNYNSSLFDADTARRMLDHFHMLLHAIVADPGQSVADLPLLTIDERAKLLHVFNETESAIPDLCAHEMFEVQAKKTPHSIAVVFEQQRLTYRELNERSNQLAHYLSENGVGPEVPVGMCIERSADMVVGIMAILKAGGAFMPIDPAYPKERIALMLEDAQPPVLLTQSWLMDVLPNTESNVICLDQDWTNHVEEPYVAHSAPLSDVKPYNLAYIIFTSGSTGRPKGVLLAHRGLTNLILAHSEGYDINAGSRVLQFASLSFDASVTEIFTTLATGAALHLARRETLLSIQSLAQLLREQRITTVTLPPTMLKELAPHDLPDLLTVISAGEQCTVDIASKWSVGRRFVNGYGPTETTIGPTYHVVQNISAETSIIPIGKPIANIQIHILDRYGGLTPLGVPGEIYVGGVGVARGYLKRPRLTAEKFIPDPFSDVPGGRLYRTGDLARRLADGSIEFLERIDHQVKVRGFRIELDEIDTQLKRHPDVRDAVTLAREDQPGNIRLVSYVLPASAQVPAVDDLRIFIQKDLPEYMAPALFILLDAFPLTPSGKVDRKALPAPTSERPELATTYVTPSNPLERMLAELWQEVLGIDKVGVRDNFFDLGGHSLLLARVHSRMQDVVGEELTMVELFRFPTIGALAERIGGNNSQDQSLQNTYDRVKKQQQARRQRRSAANRSRRR